MVCQAYYRILEGKELLNVSVVPTPGEPLTSELSRVRLSLFPGVSNGIQRCIERLPLCVRNSFFLELGLRVAYRVGK
jgi:hypothetical protein